MMKFFKQLKGTPRRSYAKAGFAMLFTVLVISIILTIALGISDTTYKQTILSSLAANSQVAFYQADSGVECGMYYETQKGLFSKGTTVNTTDNPTGGTAPAQIICGNTTMYLNVQNSYTDYLVYEDDADFNSNVPCYGITFDQATDPTMTTVSSHGYST
jgi:Tfp pilus assembly protein PilX